jgi:hypothetical protein
MGVDPHKEEHSVVVVTQDAPVQTKFKSSNSTGGFQEVFQQARAEMLKTGSKGVIFGEPLLAQSGLFLGYRGALSLEEKAKHRSATRKYRAEHLQKIA